MLKCGPADGRASGTLFRILVVDDNPADVYLLQQEALSTISRPHRLDWVKDGSEALDFLHRRGSHANALRPDLVLLDINMPLVNGLEALREIKSDPELSIIPVIMLSTSAVPDEVRESYQAHANCYVQKPTTLEQLVRLIGVIESFWMDLAILPGPSLAFQTRGASSRAVGMIDESPVKETVSSRNARCDEHRRLLGEFGTAVRDLLRLHEQQFLAITQGDPECNRFDLLIHMANEKKQLAKYAYISHLESHGC